ncbi:hypothetical protein B484DRAFT_445533 [Ochromonadaceae sp. CCMP2298]|nr:hypothetical protein B484DRAFT_445533 [Ochromonadaceae sp. CCMP2298]
MSKLVQRRASEQAQHVEPGSKISTSSRASVRKSTFAKKAMAPKKIGKPQASKKAASSDDKSSVIYIGHLPHGFFEAQLKKFFMQFGIVRKVKLFRSPRTDRSRGFAFLQFESHDTALTVAEAMHGYFLHDRQLVSHVVPTSKHHDGMWKTPKPAELREEEEKEVAEPKEKDPETVAARKEKKAEAKQQRLVDLGIDFVIPV